MLWVRLVDQEQASLGDDTRNIRGVLLNTCKDIGLTVNTRKTKYMEIGRHRGMISMRISI